MSNIVTVKLGQNRSARVKYKDTNYKIHSLTHKDTHQIRLRANTNAQAYTHIFFSLCAWVSTIYFPYLNFYQLCYRLPSKLNGEKLYLFIYLSVIHKNTQVSIRMYIYAHTYTYIGSHRHTITYAKEKKHMKSVTALLCVLISGGYFSQSFVDRYYGY